MERDGTIIAVASDQQWAELDVPVFDINDAHGIASFIRKTFIK